jgi:hypothetical protein
VKISPPVDFYILTQQQVNGPGLFRRRGANDGMAASAFKIDGRLALALLVAAAVGVRTRFGREQRGGNSSAFASTADTADPGEQVAASSALSANRGGSKTTVAAGVRHPGAAAQPAVLAPLLLRHAGSRSASCARHLRNAPTVIQSACAAFRTEAVAPLGDFFRPPGQLIRVAVADAEASRGQPRVPKPMEQSSCASNLNKTVQKYGRTESDFAHKFAAEVLLPRGLRNSRFVASATLADADYVLVTLCNIGHANNGETIREIVPFVTKDPALARAWALRRGRFLLTLTGDHGPCIQSNEKAGQFKARQWIDANLRGTTMLLNEGSTQSGCYNADTDVVIPTTAVLVEQGPLACRLPVLADTRADSRARPHLAFFAGKLDSKIRRDIAKAYVDTPAFYLPARLASGDPYLCAMASSTFCLAPRGNAAWSPRLDEALYAGCIPVILADNYDPPFSSVLNYSSFSLVVNESAVAQLGRILAAVPEDTRRQLRASGASVRPFFRYHSFVTLPGRVGEGGPAGIKAPSEQEGDATMLVAFELWRKIHRQRSA